MRSVIEVVRAWVAIDNDVPSSPVHFRGHCLYHRSENVNDYRRGLPHVPQLGSYLLDWIRRLLMRVPNKIALRRFPYQMRDIARPKSNSSDLGNYLSWKQIEIGPCLFDLRGLTYQKTLQLNRLWIVQRRKQEASPQSVRFLDKRLKSDIEFEVKCEPTTKMLGSQYFPIVADLRRRAAVGNASSNQRKKCAGKGLPLLKLPKLNVACCDQVRANGQGRDCPDNHYCCQLESLPSHTAYLHRSKISVEGRPT